MKPSLGLSVAPFSSPAVRLKRGIKENRELNSIVNGAMDTVTAIDSNNATHKN